jgi:RNAse (barnase) inhibitor barstar
MLPGTSSRKIDSKHKKLKNETESDSNREVSLQYNLDKLGDAGAYDFASDGNKSESDDDASNHDDKCETYPFASALEKDVDESEIDAESVIHICVFQINTSCELPFIEYMMKIIKNGYNTASEKHQFEFPSIKYAPSKRTVMDQAKQHMNTLLDDDEVVKYRGHLKKGNEYYLFFHKYFRKLKFPSNISMNDDALWWIVTSEIVNFKKVMYVDVDKRATDLFTKNPAIMRLYDCNNQLIETPVICYYGDQYQKITYLAFFGLLKAPLKSSFGPFYVGTNFLSSMKYACYTHDNQPFELYDGTALTTGDNGKYVEGGVLRSVLFVGKMNVFLKSGTPDNSQISQEVAKKDEAVRKLLALRDSNGNWTENYDTAYKGLYFVSIDDDDKNDAGKKNSKKRIAVNTVEWFFKDYNHTSILSYHMIDTETIPDKYNVDYSEYYIK